MTGLYPGETAEFPATVTSGYFTALGNEIDKPGGDGNKHLVTWEFDLIGTPLSANHQLQSAILTVTVTPIQREDRNCLGRDPGTSADHLRGYPKSPGRGNNISLQLLLNSRATPAAIRARLHLSMVAANGGVCQDLTQL